MALIRSIFPPPRVFQSLDKGFTPKTAKPRWQGEPVTGWEQLEPLLDSVPAWNIHLRVDATLNRQGYRWSASGNGIAFEASELSGFRHGLTALKQWADEAAVPGPGLEVRDEPAFQRRGFMLDVSRCRVPKLSSLKRLVTWMAELRLNELQLYTEHTFAYPNHEAVWRGASPLTGDEVRQLDRFCRERGIDLVPNQNCFGHMERWLIHAAYQCLAEHPNPFTNRYGTRYPVGPSLQPNGHSLDFVTGLLDTLLPCFSQRTVNIGCDETFDLGQGRTAAEVNRRGLRRVYLSYLNALADRLAKRGYEAQFWADILLEAGGDASDLADNLIPMVWGYEPDHPFDDQLARVAEGNRPFYVVPGTSGWNSFLGRLDTGEANLLRAGEAGRVAGAHGFLITEWGDNGHHQPEAVTLYGLALGAAQAWLPGGSDRSSVEQWLDRRVFVNPVGGSAAWWGQAGTAHRILEHPLPNWSPAARVLLDQPERSEAVARAIPDNRWQAFEKRLEALAEREPSLQENSDRAESLSLQRRTALAFGHLAALRASIRRGTRPLSDWTKVRAAAIDLHRASWLQTSRPGGLDQSCARIPTEP
ncbi:MAG: beta-N-acetylhexosaminidase [Opitutales bacterium]